MVITSFSTSIRIRASRSVFALTVFLVLSLCVVSAPAFAKEILFINPGHADKGFWHAVSSTMAAAAEEFGFKLTIVSADRKWPVMVSKGLEAINSGKPDYAIIVNEHQQAPVLLEAANAKGIPTLLLLNDLTDEQKKEHGQPREKYQHWIGSITPDNEIAGYEMAHSIIDRVRQKRSAPVRLLSLAGDFKTPASIARLAGLDRAIEKYKDSVDEVRRLTVNWSEDEAYERTSRLLQTTSINAVWAANDPIAFGAIRAMRERGLEPGRDIAVAGLNWSKAAVEAVIKGEMTLTHGGHFLAGAWSIVLINDFDKGADFKALGTVVHFPMSAIDQDSAQTYRAAFGDQNWEKIDFQAFSRVGGANPGGYEFTLDNILANIR